MLCSFPATGHLVALLKEGGAHALADGIGRHGGEDGGRRRVPDVVQHIRPDPVSLGGIVGFEVQADLSLLFVRLEIMCSINVQSTI